MAPGSQNAEQLRENGGASQATSPATGEGSGESTSHLALSTVSNGPPHDGRVTGPPRCQAE